MPEPLLTLAEIRLIEQGLLPQEPLMERAGRAAFFAARAYVDHQIPILVLAGPGNNGGDAFVCARYLHESHYRVSVLFLGDENKLSKDAKDAKDAYHGPMISDWVTQNWGLLVDGIFGIGLTRAPAGIYADIIQAINEHPAKVLALDCPSGLNADTGEAPGKAILADETITFIAHKPGLWTGDGVDCCGKVTLASLDINVKEHITPQGHLLTQEALKGILLPRKKNTHKGHYGRIGLIGGAKGMVGALMMASSAAQILGGGLIYLGLIDEALPYDPNHPELMCRSAPEVLDMPLDVLALGPGLSQSKEAAIALEKAIARPVPLVIDADGLNLLAKEKTRLDAVATRLMPTFLTPHPGEAARLLQCSVADIEKNRLDSARMLARLFNACVVLKGAGSIVANPEGQYWINTSGNPGMATGGMGDILTGMIAALLPQIQNPFQALAYAVYLHGAAADALAAQLGGNIGLAAHELPFEARRLINAWVTGSIKH